MGKVEKHGSNLLFFWLFIYISVSFFGSLFFLTLYLFWLFINFYRLFIKNKQNKIHDRKMTIVPEFVGLKMAIHNGMMYVHILITPEMVNHKLGEFAHTRKVKHYLSGLETSK